MVHSGRQDIALLRRELGCEVTNIFDTQVAAGFAGLGAQASYDSLLAEVLGLRVAKTASFTRWDARPLSAEQLAYAREDVVHLLELAGELERRLDELGRLEWALEECRPLSTVSDERDPQAIFERLPRVGGLNASARAVARELVEWRERTAERQDRPVQSVLSDAGLVEVARRRPGLRARTSARSAASAASAQGRRAPRAARRGRPRAPAPGGAAAAGRARSPPPKPEDLPLVALAEALARPAPAKPASPTSCSRPAPTCRRSSPPCAPAPSRRTCARCAAGARELAGDELLELLRGADRALGHARWPQPADRRTSAARLSSSQLLVAAAGADAAAAGVAASALSSSARYEASSSRSRSGRGKRRATSAAPRTTAMMPAR